MKHGKFTEPWKKIGKNWEHFGPGPRPSVKNIRDMERLFLQLVPRRKSVQALVMGATPEIRDMLAKYPHVTVTLLDINMEMIFAMTELLKRPTSREIWVRANWLSPPLPHGYYDVVFGDYIKGNIPFPKQPLLYQHIHKLLKPTGALIERVASRYPEFRVRNTADIIKKFSRIPPTYRSANDLWANLVFLTHNDRWCRSDRAFAVLRQYRQVPRMRRYEALISQLMGPGKTWDYSRDWDEDKKPIMKYFTIAAERQDDTVFHERTRVFAFKPREFSRTK